MSNQPRTRQELYDRIRQSSRDEVILEEMVRLGFWPAEGEMPQDPTDEIRRKGEIQRELAALRTENRKLHNEAAIKKQLYKERLAASKKKRQETKERREQERQARAAAWRDRKDRDIVYLGAGISGGLNRTECDLTRLQQYGLPAYGTAEEIAKAMGISISQLRFLAFSRRTAQISHYVRFKIPKKTGGERLISAPMPRLKQAQYWIAEQLLASIPLHEAAHGFCPGRSIVTNATPHLGADVVINLDLQDFFPSVSYPRIKGLFRSFGYSEAAATIFALLCTEPDVVEVDLDGQNYYVAQSQRHLPQGAPTSPVLTNLLCRRLDRRLTAMATELGYRYTRYADDLTFSITGQPQQQVGKLLRRTHAIVTHEGFTIHPQKTRVLRNGRQQEVTGVVVNEKLNIDRKTLKRFRALLHQIEQSGYDDQHWGGQPVSFAQIQGYANFVDMVNPERGAQFQAQVKRIKRKYPPRVQASKPAS